MAVKRGILEVLKTNGKIAPFPFPARVGGPSQPDLTKLGRLIAVYAPHDGSFELRIPGVHAIRLSRVNKECVHAVRLPSLCIAAQGAKIMIVGQEIYEYDSTRMIVFSVALPVAGQVTRPASPSRTSPSSSTSSRTRSPNWC